ncbi:hypothetical protein Tco_1121366 [Tanacetum coccineum]|uniref:Uncharacterized protein n=1 Tax=Tanacetum coccineum TaxID=301880 RepID=A0ABQ5IXW2_9ASTR
MAFPCLQELAATENSNNLTDAKSVFIQRKINDDLKFAARLSHLWEVLYSSVQEHKLLIAELNMFGGPLALQCAEFLKMGHTTTNRGLAATGTTGLVVGQCLGRGNTTIPVRGVYLIGLGVRSSTAAGLAGGSVATQTIIVPEVIDDCMSLQRTCYSWNKIPNLQVID